MGHEDTHEHHENKVCVTTAIDIVVQLEKTSLPPKIQRMKSNNAVEAPCGGASL
jgi:hypothetical protein